MTAPASDSASPAPDVPAQPEAVVEPTRAEPSAPPIRTLAPDRPAVVADDGDHMPVILGAVFALLIIVLGSIAARLGAKLLRARRRGSPPRAAVSMTPPMLHAQMLHDQPLRDQMLHADDAPALVPLTSREADIRRESRPPRVPRRAPAPRPAATNAGEPIAERARELEANVRDLLHRMRSDLPIAPRQPSEHPRQPPERSNQLLERPHQPSQRPREPSPPSAQELDQVLAMWREGRRRSAN